MRRKDKEVTDILKIEGIMSQCDCCRLGFYDDGEVYIVPLNFGYTLEGEAFTLYFHGAMKGRKIELTARGPEVGFEMDTKYQIIEDSDPCEFSAQYKSIIGSGKLTMVENFEEKKAALQVIMRHNTGIEKWDFAEKAINRTAVMKLDVTKISCKVSK